MTLANTINEVAKNIFGKLPGLRELEAEEVKRKEGERVADREAAFHDLAQAREYAGVELPVFEQAVIKSRERVDKAKLELAAAERALSAASDLRLSRSGELRESIASAEQRLKNSAPPEIVEFIRSCDVEFENIRREHTTSIASGRDGSTGEPTIWIRSNAKSVFQKRDAIIAARVRAKEMLLELIADPSPELAKLTASLTSIGITVEETKGRFATPAPQQYDRYSDREMPKSDPPMIEHW